MSPIKVREFLTVKRFEVRELSENQLVKNDKKSEKSPILVREKKKKSIVYPSPRKVREWKFLGLLSHFDLNREGYAPSIESALFEACPVVCLS
jgi:hypothetical protein